MATVQQAAPPALQPTIAALLAFQAALTTLAGTPGAALDNPNALNTDAGSTSAAYITITNLLNLTEILLDALQSNQSTAQVEVLGGTLYDLASLYYDDITQAFALMYANGLITPWLSNSVPATISIPTAQSLTPSTGIAAAQVSP